MGFNRKLQIGFLVLLVLWLAVPNVLGTKMDIAPIADSYTSSIDPTANYGGSEFLDSHYYAYEILGQDFTQASITWLKFNLSAIPSEATVNSIILRLHTGVIGPQATNIVGVFLGSSSNWQEMTITWNNSPQITGASISTAVVTTGDKDYDFDVTSAVKGKSAVTLALKTLDSTSLVGFATFYSRDKQETYYRPRLVVDYSTPSSPSAPIDLYQVLLAVVVILVIVFLVVYIVVRRKQQPAQETSQKPDTLAIS